MSGNVCISLLIPLSPSNTMKSLGNEWTHSRLIDLQWLWGKWFMRSLWLVMFHHSQIWIVLSVGNNIFWLAQLVSFGGASLLTIDDWDKTGTGTKNNVDQDSCMDCR